MWAWDRLRGKTKLGFVAWCHEALDERYDGDYRPGDIPGI
jgi:hypothetical protein